MHKTNLFLALALLVVLPLRAGLTVVVSVDGLYEGALKELQPYWSQGGLRTLSEEAYQTTVGWDHWLYGGDEALVTLLTGVNPSEHGIGSNMIWDSEERQVVNCFQGDRRMGIGLDTGYCADHLLVPTMTDRLRLSEGNNTKIYAIGIDASTTVALAGHAANGCCWLGRRFKGDTLRWVSTSYYREGLPEVADRQNMSGELLQLMGRTWTPRMDIRTYLHATDEEKKKGFSYRLAGLPMNRFVYSNTAVVNLALALQQDRKLGMGNQLDVLLLQLSVVSPKASQCGIHMAEQEDMYLALNQDLGYLLEQLERRVGRDGLRVVVVGIPKKGEDRERMRSWNMDIHTLSIDKVTALTSTYLMALYGHERWIDGGWGHSVWLNRTLIEQKHLNIETIRRQVADFLMEFQGIRYACPASEAYLHPHILPSLNKNNAGDVVFLLQGDYSFDGCTPIHSSAPVMIWSGLRKPFPPLIHKATEVANYLL